MGKDTQSLFGLSAEEQLRLLEQLGGTAGPKAAARVRDDRPVIADEFARIEALPGYKEILVQRGVAEAMQISDPFFLCHEGTAKSRTVINGRSFINFSTYDYLDLNGHPEIIAAAHEAMQRYGTSAGASRLVAGERPPHRLLEEGLAGALGCEACLSFVSGHATNVSTIYTLLGPKDAVFYDALAHNSLLMGAVMSGAARHKFKHNDMTDLRKQLERYRHEYERVLIATEGLFSMDGSIVKLPELLELKSEFKCFLLLDEAHSIGVLGERGLGATDYFGISPAGIDIIMGTLSKSLCGCGGFVCGSRALIELLKFKAPGFVYSVGMPPPMAAASAKALELMLREPERVRKLQKNSRFFMDAAKLRGMDTGFAEGYAVVPVIVGGSITASRLTQIMLSQGVNVLPIIYPAVEENMARLRFFISSASEEGDMLLTLDILRDELDKLNAADTPA